MTDAVEPTEEGKRRYRRTGGYQEWDNGSEHGGVEKIPCTCNYTCRRGCDGRCGCRACSLLFAVYADQSGWVGPQRRRIRGWMIRQYARMFPPTRPYRAGLIHKRLRGEPKVPRRHMTHVGGAATIHR